MPDQILNPDQCNCINDALQAIAHTRDLIMRCKNCGLDVTHYEQQLEAQAQVAEGIKRNFMPNVK